MLGKACKHNAVRTCRSSTDWSHGRYRTAPLGSTVEFVRNLVVACALAWLVVSLDVAGWLKAARLGILVWIVFPVAMAVILGVWR